MVCLLALCSTQIVSPVLVVHTHLVTMLVMVGGGSVGPYSADGFLMKMRMEQCVLVGSHLKDFCFVMECICQ